MAECACSHELKSSSRWKQTEKYNVCSSNPIKECIVKKQQQQSGMRHYLPKASGNAVDFVIFGLLSFKNAPLYGRCIF